MKLSQFKSLLDKISELNFIQPNGNFVPRHFHITEAGLTTKHFVDCGGTIRMEKTASLQLWVADDFEHRLEPRKLKKIIDISTPLFGNEDPEVEIEYQNESISRYGLQFNGHQFMLTNKQTNCLAKDQCGIPQEKLKMKLSDLQTVKNSCCSPDSGCC